MTTELRKELQGLVRTVSEAVPKVEVHVDKPSLSENGIWFVDFSLGGKMKVVVNWTPMYPGYAVYGETYDAGYGNTAPEFLIDKEGEAADKIIELLKR